MSESLVSPISVRNCSALQANWLRAANNQLADDYADGFVTGYEVVKVNGRDKHTYNNYLYWLKFN